MTRTARTPDQRSATRVRVIAPWTWEKIGRIFDGPPLTKDMPIASSMPQSSALAKNAWSRAAEDAPLRFIATT